MGKTKHILMYICVIPTLRIGDLLTLSWLLVMVGSSPQLCPTMRVPVRPLGVVYRWKREGMKGPYFYVLRKSYQAYLSDSAPKSLAHSFQF